MNKFIILTDSNGNPRGFPESEVFNVEDTYPYLIRKYFEDSIFWQISFGDITSIKLLNQPMAYLFHWNPDVIIVQSGFNDCKPEAFSDFQKELLNKVSWRFFDNIKKYVDHPALIKRRQIRRVSKNKFRRTAKKFKLTFPKAKIFWLEICSGFEYEEACPGITRRMDEYNGIIRELYEDDFVPVQREMMSVDGFNAFDHFHWNKRGHKVVSEILIKKISSCFPERLTEVSA